MKKIAYLLMIFTFSIFFAACNLQKEDEEKPRVMEPNSRKVEEGHNQEKKDENTVNQNGLNSNTSKDTVYHNEVFKDVTVSETDFEIIVAGEAQVFEGVFQYALYDGEKLLIENNCQTDGAPAWGEFKITFKKNLVSTNEVHFELFVYSAKDGSKVNTLDIPIPKT